MPSEVVPVVGQPVVGEVTRGVVTAGMEEEMHQPCLPSLKLTKSTEEEEETEAGTVTKTVWAVVI